MKHIVSIFFLLMAWTAAPQAHAVIGTWKAYMAYSDITEVAKGGSMLYVLASKNLYTYNPADQEVRTFDKANGLSDCSIAHIAWSDAASRLVIVYDNTNIDIMTADGQVTNLSDYYSKLLNQDKTVYSIDINGADAYLATGFGLVKLQLRRMEISDTYDLGFKVDYSYIADGRIYAASPEKGLFSAPLTANLADPKTWTRTGGYVARTSQTDPELLAQARNASPGGPRYNHFGYLKFYQGALYSCGGGWGLYDQNRPGTIQIYKNRQWQIYEAEDIPAKTGHSYADIKILDIDPTDPGHVFAAGRTGLYEFYNGTFIKAYSYDNSDGLLQVASTVTDKTNKDYVIVSALNFDPAGNLWLFNSISPTTSLIQLTKDGKWINHHDSELMHSLSNSLENVVSMTFDSRGLLWFCNYHWNTPALISYDPSTDKLNRYTSFVNDDGTQLNLSIDGGITSICEDLNNDLWIGTTIGPFRFDKERIADSNPVLTQVKVPRNDGTNLADYLLSGVSVSCMAIDAAGRKWIGTNSNGVYLISADNMTQIHHFLSADSPLLSDNIESIAIDKSTGEVFFGTDQGLCSYMSDASEDFETMTKDNVWAYPNPVRPEYTGLITIRGLSLDADVKIVTSNGVLVKEGRSNGGTFTWDGLDLKGRRVASGVYMVQTATAEGKKGTVCKIAIVR